MEERFGKVGNTFRVVMNISSHACNLFLFLFAQHVLLCTSRNPELESVISDGKNGLVPMLGSHVMKIQTFCVLLSMF